jgi:hypothetical protein
MTIPPAALPQYLDLSAKALLRVRESLGSSVWRFLPHKHVLALAGAEAVYGVGSPTRLKYVVLQVSPEKAEEIVGDERERMHQSHASQTTRIERPAGVAIYQHHERCFSWPTMVPA